MHQTFPTPPGLFLMVRPLDYVNIRLQNVHMFQT